MIPLRALLLPATLVVLSAGPAAAAHYKLFVLTGQSNLLGTTGGGEPDPSPGTDPGDAGVSFFWHNVADASTSLGDSGGQFTTLQEQQGGFYAGNATHWGPEMNFGRTFYRAGVRDFGVIKASRGGGGNTNWSKSSGGHMYTHVVDTVTAASTALTNAGDTFEIVGLLYLQGESDSAGEASIADTRLSELIANLRSDLPNAADMHAVAGGIAAAGGNRDMVRAKQAALAAGDPTISYFENLDLQPQLYDGLHFDRAAKLTVGERYAQAFFDAGVCTPDFGDLAFIGDSITQGGLGFPSYRYQVFKHLVDRSATYTFVGSVTGAYQFQDVTASTPPYGGQVFSNVHDGHFGWRAFWENGRVPLPSNRRSNNRGEGTVENWTGQSTQYEVDSSGNFVSYPDPLAAGSGNTGTTYVPDTAVIMAGINDIAGGGSITQLRDDLGTMIDQLRAANPNVRIHVNRLLSTNQGATFRDKVDDFNALLQPLADAKNAASATSPVWIIDASKGFEPATMTHDAVHPNTEGEEYVGDRIAAGLGLIATPLDTTPPSAPPTEKETLDSCYEGNEIWTVIFMNGWDELNGTGAVKTLSGDLSDLRYDHSGSGSATMLDGTATGWTTGNRGDWTFETRLNFLANPSGFMLWLGTGSRRILVEIHADRTQDFGANAFNVPHNNLDGQFHLYRVAHDSIAGVYHVWRDGERLTPVDGAAYDQAGADSRLLMGDFTGGAFGNDFNVDIDYVCYDLSGAYLPPGADADGDGMPDAWEYEHFGTITGGEPAEDNDGDGSSNLEEYYAGTDPWDPESFFHISSITDDGGTVSVTVADTSPDRQYTLHKSDDVGITDPWTAIAGPVPGTGGDLVMEDPDPNNPDRFYRVEVGLP